MNMAWRCLCTVGLGIVTLLSTFNATAEREQIYVGGYLFSPYVNTENEGRYYGLTLDLITKLNRIQPDYEFKFVETSIEQRYKAFELRRFDMMMFENISWGWEGKNVEFAPIKVIDGEKFITLAAPNKTQVYFNSFDDKQLILVKGYHYNFANWESDPNYLAQHFNVQFVNSNKASIEGILKQRGDIAPITWSYLKDYLKRTPEHSDQFLISDHWDQEYKHGVLLRKDSHLSLSTLTALIKKLETTGEWETLLNHYGLSSVDLNSQLAHD